MCSQATRETVLIGLAPGLVLHLKTIDDLKKKRG